MTSRNRAAARLQGVTPKQPFETVVATHGATVLRVCRAVLQPVDADDAWSETFMAALKAYRQLPDDANIEAWLVTIAHRKVIDITRASARRTRRTTELNDATLPAPPTSGESDPDLASAVAQLPTKQKQAVAYHYLAGLPYAEVATILGGTTEAARRAAADGVATLRRTYRDAGVETGEIS
jgi:RNA polymerase sigma factor (sigma-70 family)